MRTRALTTVIVAILSIGFVFATSELSAQSSTRRGTTGGNSTTSTRSTSTSGSQDRNKNVAPSSNRSGNNSGNRNSNNPPKSSTIGTSGRNYNDHISNINTGHKDRPNGNVNTPDRKNGNDKNRPDNNKPGNYDNNKPGNNKPGNNKPNNYDNNRPGNNKPGNYNGHNGGNNDRYGGNRGSDNPPKISKNPPKDKKPNSYSPPRYNRNDPNRHLGYTPFRDGRVIHRPAPYRSAFDFGVRFSTRPSASIKIRFGGLTLYFSSGVWYNYSNGYYTVYRPPVGTVISYNNIANDLYYVDFEVVMDYGTTYYVDSYANFYMPVRNFRTYGNTVSLEVVNAPIGAILYDLPSDYREIVRNGITYYVVGNSVFEYIYSTAHSWYFRCIGVYK